MTTTETLQALTDGFNAAGIDTPEKVEAFVMIAALQVKANSQAYELEKLTQAHGQLLSANQAEREAKQAEINATKAALLAAVAAQAE